MSEAAPAPYGFCPACGAAGVSRERRPNGNDRCEAGHVYPSRDAKDKPKKPRKYRNQPVIVDGIRFASKAEAARDAELKLLERAGQIRMVRRQPRFPLIVNGQKVCTYVGDWEYVEITDGEKSVGEARIVEDRKGVLTPAFKIKWALAKALHPDIEWRLS